MILIVENERTSIQGADHFILHLLDRELRYNESNPEQFTQENKDLLPDNAWDGWVRLLHRPKKMLPWFRSGLVTLVQRLIEKYKYTYSVDDRRKRPKEGFPELVEIPLRDYQRKAVDCAVKEGRGVLDMVPRCHAAGEPILMADGTTKPVEDVQVGDRLIGPDSTVRRVLELHSGEDLLYEIVPRFGGEPFTVNQHHELVLICGKYLAFVEQVTSVHEYVKAQSSLPRKMYLKLKGVEFPDVGEKDLSVDPYVLGVILGRGYLVSFNVVVHTNKIILQVALQLEAYRLGMDMSITERKNRPTVCRFKHASGANNAFKLVQILEKFGLMGCLAGDKFIPQHYLVSKKEQRLQLLGGLLDTDGRLVENCYYEYLTKSARLAQGIRFLAGSLGFGVTSGIKSVKGVTCYLTNIFGNVDGIPVRVPREIISYKSVYGDAGRTSFKVRPKGRGKFYGFTVDGDNRYVSAGFIELKNSGKTRIACEVQRNIALPTVWVVPTDGIATQTKRVFDEFFYDAYSYHLVGSKQYKLDKAKKTSVVICTMATAAQLPDDFYQSRQCIIVDEFHRSAAKSFNKIFDKCAHIYFRYGMTGTFFRSSGDDLAMHAHLRETIYRITSADLLKYGYLVPTKVVFLPITQRMPRSKHGRMDSTFYMGHGKYGIHEFQYRNDIAAQCVYWLNRYGYRVLVLVGTKKQGQLLKANIEQYIPKNKGNTEFDVVEFISTDTPRRIQPKILKAFLETQEVRVLLGTTLLGEGVDLPTVDALVYVRGEKAEVSLTQAAYRTCTAVEGKERAIIVDFADRHNRKLLEHSQERLEVYFKEPIFDVDILEDVGQFNHWLERETNGDSSK